MRRRFHRVVLGGTFDRLHRGHEALLATAFRLGEKVSIGLTSRRYLAQHPKPPGPPIASEDVRRRNLLRWLGQRYSRRRWQIVPIDDPYGGSVRDGVDALVVSADTVRGGRAVNRARKRMGRSPVPLIVVPLVLADDLEPLSSRRIRAGEVDPEGRRRARLEVGLCADGEEEREAALAGIRRAIPRARIKVRAPVRRPSSAGQVRRLASRARGRLALGVAVTRRPRAGWWVAVQGPHVGLGPRALPGASLDQLARRVAEVLRPAPPKRL